MPHTHSPTTTITSVSHPRRDHPPPQVTHERDVPWDWPVSRRQTVFFYFFWAGVWDPGEALDVTLVLLDRSFPTAIPPSSAPYSCNTPQSMYLDSPGPFVSANFLSPSRYTLHQLCAYASAKVISLDHHPLPLTGGTWRAPSLIRVRHALNVDWRNRDGIKESRVPWQSITRRTCSYKRKRGGSRPTTALDIRVVIFRGQHRNHSPSDLTKWLLYITQLLGLFIPSTDHRESSRLVL